MPRVRRILHPSDFSRASSAAFGRAMEMAKANRAELLLLHVLAPVAVIPAGGGGISGGYISPTVYEQLETSNRAAAQKQLGALVAKARKAGVKVSSVLLDGMPANQIARAAKSRRADVIVIGTHGRSNSDVVLDLWTFSLRLSLPRFRPWRARRRSPRKLP
jgi:nucleotide-binding universal stress UspA family protein